MAETMRNDLRNAHYGKLMNEQNSCTLYGNRVLGSRFGDEARGSSLPSRLRLGGVERLKSETLSGA